MPYIGPISLWTFFVIAQIWKLFWQTIKMRCSQAQYKMKFIQSKMARLLQSYSKLTFIICWSTSSYGLSLSFSVKNIFCRKRQKYWKKKLIFVHFALIDYFIYIISTRFFLGNVRSCRTYTYELTQRLSKFRK